MTSMETHYVVLVVTIMPMMSSGFAAMFVSGGSMESVSR